MFCFIWLLVYGAYEWVGVNVWLCMGVSVFVMGVSLGSLIVCNCFLFCIMFLQYFSSLDYG